MNRSLLRSCSCLTIQRRGTLGSGLAYNQANKIRAYLDLKENFPGPSLYRMTPKYQIHNNLLFLLTFYLQLIKLFYTTLKLLHLLILIEVH